MITVRKLGRNLVNLSLIASVLLSPLFLLFSQHVQAFNVEDVLGSGPYRYVNFKSTVDLSPNGGCAKDADCLSITSDIDASAFYAGSGGANCDCVIFQTGSSLIYVKKSELGKGYADRLDQNTFDIAAGIDTARTFLKLPPPENPTGDTPTSDSLPNDGEWKDQTTILYNGKYFRDSDIFKGENEYEQVDGNCKSKIKVIDMAGGGESATLTQNEGSPCVLKASKTIHLNNGGSTGYQQINAYRLNWDTDDQTIFMPQYSDCAIEGTSLDCPTKTMGFFRRQPVGNPLRNDDKYWQWAGKNGYIKADCGDIGKVWISYNDKQQRTQNSACRGIASVQLLLANKGIQPPEDVYGKVDLANATVEGANGNPGGTSLGDNGGTIVAPEKKSCESENPGAIDWVICAVIGGIDNILVGNDGAGGLLHQVDQLLNIDQSQYSNEDLKTAWSYFRNIASLMLVLIGLVMVIGQAISKE